MGILYAYQPLVGYAGALRDKMETPGTFNSIVWVFQTLHVNSEMEGVCKVRVLAAVNASPPTDEAHRGYHP